jgi:hypothetical protein
MFVLVLEIDGAPSIMYLIPSVSLLPAGESVELELVDLQLEVRWQT